MDLGWGPPQRDLGRAWEPDRPFRFGRERYSTYFLIHFPDSGQFPLFLYDPHYWNDWYGRGSRRNAHTDTYANAYTDTNGHACADCDPNANPHPDAHTSRNLDTNVNAGGDTNTDTDPAGANANCGPHVNTNPTTEPNADGGPCHSG
jgi:hypothetical protein